MFQHSLASGSEVNRAPPSLYNDPYLSSSSHVRQASHDSGLGATALPYQSDMGMEFDEGMDVSSGVQSSKSSFSSGNRGPPNRTLEYLETMSSSEVDTGLQESPQVMTTDQPMQEQMEGEFLERLAWV